MRAAQTGSKKRFTLSVGNKLLLSFLGFGALIVLIEVNAMDGLSKIDASFRTISETRVGELEYSVKLSRSVDQIEALLAQAIHLSHSAHSNGAARVTSFETQMDTLVAGLSEDIDVFPMPEKQADLRQHLVSFQTDLTDLTANLRALFETNELVMARSLDLKILHERSRLGRSEGLRLARESLERRVNADSLSTRLGGEGLSNSQLRALILEEMDTLRTGLLLGGAIDTQILLLRGAFGQASSDVLMQDRAAALDNLETLRSKAASIPGFTTDIIEDLQKFTDGETSVFDLQGSRLSRIVAVDTSLDRSLADLGIIKSAATNLVEVEVLSIQTEAKDVADTLSTSILNLRVLSGVGIVGVLLLGVGGVWYSVSRPLKTIANVTERLSKGDLDARYEDFKRGDEFGRIAKALEVFRQQVQEIDRLSQEKATQQAAVEHERAQMMSDMRSSFGEVMQQAAEGDLTVRVTDDFKDPELKAMSQDLNTLLSQLEEGLEETSSVLAAMAQADFSKRVKRVGQGAFGRLSQSTNATAEKLAHLIHDIREAALEVDRFSQHIAMQCDGVAREAEHQSDAVKESSKAIQSVSEMVSANADVADQASDSARDVAEAARFGRGTVEAAGKAVARIADGAKQVSGSLTVIDSIAFQTNLLALNAAVEAARAGEAGKGFAVVAAEVRALAQRSADAASEIKAVLAENEDAVEDGVKLVNEASDALGTIDNRLKGLSDNVETIALASADQSAGLEQTNNTVSEINLATRQMADNTQKSAQGAAHLLDIVKRLEHLVATFHLELDEKSRKNGEAPPALPIPPNVSVA
ncbi:MAG: HAMP domain-containing methyl-accepting chemotaxis protein [Pseudomonadota bacterium]